MVQFPEEILVNILSRLHVRSLVRFKCVSKFWTTLISDPYFTKKHLNRARNDQDSQKLLIYQWGPKDSTFSLYCCPLSPVQHCPSTLKPRNCLIHCCYNGLVIIEIRAKYRVKILLWNPSIRESIVLPPLGCPGDRHSHFGLGYDSSSGEYKILHMHQNLDGPNYPNEILALKDGSWRIIDEHPRANRCWFYATDSLPFIHAAFHWIQVSRNYFVVISFNISNEVYGDIPLAEEILSLMPGLDTIGVSVLEGMLCVHSNLFFTGNGNFKVWVLKEYGVKESWMPLLTIVKDTPYVYAAPRHRFADGEVLFWCLNIETRGHAFRTVSRSFRSWPRWVTRGHTFRMTWNVLDIMSNCLIHASFLLCLSVCEINYLFSGLVHNVKCSFLSLGVCITLHIPLLDLRPGPGRAVLVFYLPLFSTFYPGALKLQKEREVAKAEKKDMKMEKKEKKTRQKT
ncbi:hypothetical protein MTR67_046810 [Solanum verrucosum]|uniref:F-box domain-containing protein n=1 Tax=Solanum verrucosum TaxID=315347 RepID=A0AAF0UVA8_SOLVR|nr:hypothetical protein MTR67_046810 [Solanum verrucosum]